MRLTTNPEARKSEAVRKGLKLLRDLRPQWNVERGDTDLYYWFWGTRAAFQAGGDDWTAWEKALKTAVLAAQHPKGAGARAGSWDPVGPWARDGGRIYSTAIVALTLQTYREPLVAK